ncbi:hypothetical protein K502DRAFT_211293 [Neoconidiobolus thromboides FSU 785]|nr:hypothetical protein K502DRAFT_211293 [Neoconidiobolus thromboides FSU 785]
MRINENSYKSQINKLTEIEERFNSLKDEHSKCIDKENEMISESKKIKDELNSELKTLKREVSHLQSLHQKKDKQIENLKTQLDLKTQNYESELTNHAEKIKSNHKTKKENEKLQKEVLELKTKVELAKAENDSIVFDLKSQIETNNLTIAGLEQRISHLTATNDTLLAQIEKAEAKVNTSFISVMSEEENLASSESNTVNYDLIKYFKKEKEVVLARIEVLGAENSRIKNERDNIRKELDHDAKRGQDMNQISHLKQQLDEKILHLKQLNESNIHLRQDNDSLLKKKSKLEVKLIDTEKRSLSVDAKLQEVEKTIEEKDKQISDLKKDNEHWINRAQQILNSERVDPADHQKVKDELDAANKALSESKHSLEKLDLTVKELEEARNELNSVSVALKEAQISIEQYKLDIESLKANNKNELTDLKEKLNKQAKIMVAYKKKLQQVQANNAQQGGANNAQQGGTEASNKLQDNYNAAQQEISQLKQQVSSSSLEVSKLNQELDQVKKERAEIITRIKSGEDSNQNQGNNENLKSSLESKNKELETLNSTIRVLQEDKSVLESKVSSLANDSKLLYESMRLLVIPEDKKNETPNKISQIIKLYGKYKVMANSQPKDKAQGSTEVKGDSVKGKAQGTSEVREENDKQVQELEKEISSLKEELSLIRTSYDKLVTDNQLTKESNHKLAHDIASLQTVNGNQLEEINSLKVELSAKLAEINSLSQEIEKVTEEKRKVVSTLEMRGKALSTKHVNQSKKLQEEISELKNEVSRLNNELSGFKEPNSNPVAIPNPNMESNTFSEQLVNENINDNGSTNLHREQQSESDNVDKALEIRSSTILPSSTDEIINQNSDIQSTQTEDAQIRNKRKSPVPENIPAPESEVLHLNKKVKEAEVKDDSLGNDPQAVSENKNEALGSEPLDAPEQGTKPVNENEEGDLEVEGLSPLPENLDLGDLSDNEPNNEQ